MASTDTGNGSFRVNETIDDGVDIVVVLPEVGIAPDLLSHRIEGVDAGRMVSVEEGTDLWKGSLCSFPDQHHSHLSWNHNALVLIVSSQVSHEALEVVASRNHDPLPHKEARRKGARCWIGLYLTRL